jgi:hypothetical protein
VVAAGELPILGKVKVEVLWTRFRPCSTSVPRFQPNADELTTVLSGACCLEAPLLLPLLPLLKQA